MFWLYPWQALAGRVAVDGQTVDDQKSATR